MNAFRKNMLKAAFCTATALGLGGCATPAVRYAQAPAQPPVRHVVISTSPHDYSRAPRVVVSPVTPVPVIVPPYDPYDRYNRHDRYDRYDPYRRGRYQSPVYRTPVIILPPARDRHDRHPPRRKPRYGY